MADALLLEDGASFLLLEDALSKILLETPTTARPYLYYQMMGEL